MEPRERVAPGLAHGRLAAGLKLGHADACLGEGDGGGALLRRQRGDAFRDTVGEQADVRGARPGRHRAASPTEVLQESVGGGARPLDGAEGSGHLPAGRGGHGGGLADAGALDQPAEEAGQGRVVDGPGEDRGLDRPGDRARRVLRVPVCHRVRLGVGAQPSADSNASAFADTLATSASIGPPGNNLAA